MSAGEIDIAYLLRLSRIHVDEKEWGNLENELGLILDWVGELAEVDTTGVVPMTSCAFEDLPRREDAITAGEDAEAVLANAPDRFMNFYVVPKVVE